MTKGTKRGKPPKGWKNGYKVVARFDSEYRSAYRPGNTRSVVYRPGQPTRPKEGCGPLAVFGRKREALRFIKNIGTTYLHLYLFRCTYTPSKHQGLWDKEGPAQCRMLPSTRFADEVTILEEVSVQV